MCAPWQRHLWNLFENPHHSTGAKVRFSLAHNNILKKFLIQAWIAGETMGALLQCHILNLLEKPLPL
jgi:hypothetical protein